MSNWNIARQLALGTIGATVLSTSQAQTNLTTAPPSTPAPAKTKASAGLVNDWLRDQSPAINLWDLGGQFRLRYEGFDDADPAFPSRDFQADGSFNDQNYLWLREKLHLGYNGQWFTAFAEGRNSNAIGDEDPRDLGEDSFDLHQAFVTLGNAQEFPLTAKVGRQELSYGDERLIGRADWNNTGRVFDAAKLRFETKAFWLDAFASHVVVVEDEQFNEPDNQDWFFGLYGSSKTLIPIQESQVYVLSRNSSEGAVVAPRDIVSVGARVKSLPGKLKGFDYTAEAVGQFGSIRQGGERRDQRAFAASVGAGHTWKDAVASPRLGLEYNFSTGDNDPNDGTSETLDNLFPTNHKKYGYMDFVGWRNIHNPRLSLAAKPFKRLTATLDYHLFWLADTHDYFYPQSGSGRNGNGYGRNSQFDSFVGSEIDFDVNFALALWASVQAGYGHFFTGSYVDQSKRPVGGSTDADWFYGQITFDF